MAADSCSGSCGRKATPGRVRAGRREVEVDDGPEEAVRHLDEDAGAVADVGLGVGGPAVVEVAEGGQPELDHPMRASPVHVGDEGDAAGIVLEARVVEALLGGQHQQLSIPGAVDRREQVQSSAVGRRWPAAGRTTLPIRAAEAANRYHHRQRAGVGGQVVSGGSNAEMADVTEAYGAARELLRPRGGGCGADPRRRRSLSPAARAGGRAPRRQGPSPARRGRAEGRGHRPDPCRGAGHRPRRSAGSRAPSRPGGSRLAGVREPRGLRPPASIACSRRPSPGPSTGSFTSGP